MTDAELLAELIERGVLQPRWEEVTQQDASGNTIMVVLLEWFETEPTKRMRLEHPLLVDDIPKPYHDLARRLTGDAN